MIAAEQRIGELLLAIPKQAGASNFSRDEEKLKTKGETIKESGLSQRQADKAAEKLVENSPQVPRTANQGLEKSPKVEKKNRQHQPVETSLPFWRILQNETNQLTPAKKLPKQRKTFGRILPKVIQSAQHPKPEAFW